MKIYFLGGGNMATAIAGSLVKQDGYHCPHCRTRREKTGRSWFKELGVATPENLPR